MWKFPPSDFLREIDLKGNSWRKGKKFCRKEKVDWENLDWFKEKKMMRKLISKKGPIGKFGPVSFLRV